MISRRSILAAPALWLPGQAQARGHGQIAPFNATLVSAGDSISQALATISPSVVNWYNTQTCIQDWANVLGGSRFRVPQGGNQAVGGTTSTQIASTFTSVLAPFAPSIIFCNGGVNDIASLGSSAATILANWTSIVSQAAAMGAYLIILPILPTSALSGAQLTTKAAVNAGLAALASSRVGIIDITGFDYTLDCYPQVLGVPGELIHPNIIGARLLAQSMIQIINGIIPSGTILQTASDPLNLFPLGFMAGTGGTLTSATGQVATGWTLDGSAAGGATVVGSKSANPAGGSWQNVVISGTYTGSTPVVVFSSQNALAGVSINQLIEGTLAIEVDAGATNIDSVGVGILLFDGTFAHQTESSLFQTNNANVNGGFNVAQFSGGIARVMPVSMSAATPAFATIFVIAYLRQNGSGSAVSGTFRIGQVGLRKL